ncbi:hypothetical protein [Thiomicrospira microaerophila]|uniref:hypothetical protein n=1 Tax=Thiomicrospira microaerophila TaxID=406020 RepID=UPI000698F161|nr:hypothetical protein [Thiomicrospira microaerophila]
MSIGINPNLSSMALSMMPNQNQASSQDSASRVSDRPTSSVSAAGNDTVTLSSATQGVNGANDYMNLAASQTVNANNPVQEQAVQTNDTTNGLTYASNLQAAANFNAQQLNQVGTEQSDNRQPS